MRNCERRSIVRKACRYRGHGLIWQPQVALVRLLNSVYRNITFQPFTCFERDTGRDLDFIAHSTALQPAIFVNFDFPYVSVDHTMEFHIQQSRNDLIPHGQGQDIVYR